MEKFQGLRSDALEFAREEWRLARAHGFDDLGRQAGFEGEADMDVEFELRLDGAVNSSRQARFPREGRHIRAGNLS